MFFQLYALLKCNIWLLGWNAAVCATPVRNLSYPLPHHSTFPRANTIEDCKDICEIMGNHQNFAGCCQWFEGYGLHPSRCHLSDPKAECNQTICEWFPTDRLDWSPNIEYSEFYSAKLCELRGNYCSAFYCTNTAILFFCKFVKFIICNSSRF